MTPIDRAKVILHLKKNDLGRDLYSRHLELYAKLQNLCAEYEIPMEIKQRAADIKIGTRSISDARFDDGNLHIIDDRSVQADNVLNAGAAYFWKFWHLDPNGVKAFSSIGRRNYDPSTMPVHRAMIFYKKMQQRYVATRKSKYSQPSGQIALPNGAIAVFFQGDYPQNSGAASLSDIDMLDIVMAEAGDQPIVVKLHPLVSNDFDRLQVQARAKLDERITLTDANVHDILRSSHVSVSMNSTVALEGFLHKTPAILFAKSDFHHFVSTVGPELSFTEALQREHYRDEYEQYFAWYFLRNCLALNSGKFSDHVWQAFETAGFPKERLVRN